MPEVAEPSDPGPRLVAHSLVANGDQRLTAGSQATHNMWLLFWGFRGPGEREAQKTPGTERFHDTGRGIAVALRWAPGANERPFHRKTRGSIRNAWRACCFPSIPGRRRAWT